MSRGGKPKTFIYSHTASASKPKYDGWRHVSDPKQRPANFLGTSYEYSPLFKEPERDPPPPPTAQPPSTPTAPSASLPDLPWDEEKERTKAIALRELETARKQLLGYDYSSPPSPPSPPSLAPLLDRPPGFDLPPAQTTTLSPTTTPTTTATTPPAPKLTPEEEKKKKMAEAYKVWQQRQTTGLLAAKKPRITVGGLVLAKPAAPIPSAPPPALSAPAAGPAAGPALPGGKATPVAVPAPAPTPKPASTTAEGKSCQACQAFGYDLVEVKTPVLGQTIVYYYCWDCVPGTEAAAKKASRKRTVRIRGEGVLVER